MDYLQASIEKYYFAPSFALWRAIELRLLSREDYHRPILDLGCGDGGFSSLLFQGGRIDIGIDIDTDEVRKAGATSIYDQALRMDGSRMDFPDNEFNTVFSNCVLEHVPRFKETLEETFRVLHPGGSLIFTVPSDKYHEYLYQYKALLKRHDLAGANKYLRTNDQRHAHVNFLSADDWTKLLRGIGFGDIEMEYYLPERTLSIWDRMEVIYTSEFYSVLESGRLRAKCIPLILLPAYVQKKLWYFFLRSYYVADVRDAEKGGAILIKCRKC